MKKLILIVFLGAVFQGIHPAAYEVGAPDAGSPAGLKNAMNRYRGGEYINTPAIVNALKENDANALALYELQLGHYTNLWMRGKSSSSALKNEIKKVAQVINLINIKTNCFMGLECKRDLTEEDINQIKRLCSEVNLRLRQLNDRSHNFSVQDLYLSGGISIEANPNYYSQLTLELSGKNINDLDGLRTIPGIENIKVINLSHNAITDWNPGTFDGLNLDTLNLSYNKIKTLKSGAFTGLRTKELFLQKNPIASVDDFAFTGIDLDALKSITLDGDFDLPQEIRTKVNRFAAL